MNARKHRAVAPIGEHGERARINTLACGRTPHGLGHVRIDDPPTIERGLFDAATHWVGDVALETFIHALAREPKATARKVCIFGQQSEYEVRVGHRRQLSASRITDGPGSGAGALWSDAKHAGVHVTDRTASGSQGFDAHHGCGDEVSVMPVPAALGRGLAAEHQRDVVTGSAHIDAEQIRFVFCQANVSRSDDAARGPGRENANRALAQVVSGHYSAARLHHQQFVWIAGVPKACGQGFEVARDPRPHIRVDDRGAGSFELGCTREYFAGERDFGLGHFFANHFGEPSFVACVHERK